MKTKEEYEAIHRGEYSGSPSTISGGPHTEGIQRGQVQFTEIPSAPSRGPWELQLLEETRHGYPNWSTYCVRDAVNHCIAVVGEVDRGTEEHNEANGKIMAASYELLDACKNAVIFSPPCVFAKGIDGVEYHQLRDGSLGGTREECWKCKCVAAIAKATGFPVAEPDISISLGDTIQCIEDNWQGRVTALDTQDGVTMLVCHHWSGAQIELDDKRWFDPRDVRLLRKGTHATFPAKLTQFMRPSGTAKSVTTDLPLTSEQLYHDMHTYGCRLECEVLTTDEVSVTVSNDDGDHDFSVTKNGPEVQEGIVSMLWRQCWLKLKPDGETP